MFNVDLDDVHADWPKRTPDRLVDLAGRAAEAGVGDDRRRAGGVGRPGDRPGWQYDLVGLRHLPGQHDQKTHGHGGGGSDAPAGDREGEWEIPEGRVCQPRTGLQQIDEQYRDLPYRTYTLKKKNGTTETVDVSDADLDAHFDEVIGSATPDQLREGKEWYDVAHREAVAMSEEYGVSVEQAAGVIAALSPNRGWAGNLTVARKALAAYQSGKYRDLSDEDMAAEIHVGFKSDALQAVKIMRDAGNLGAYPTGLKRQSFTNNIVNPSAGYDCTVDGWVAASLVRMGRASGPDAGLGWLTRTTTRNKRTVIDGDGYVRVADSLRRVADRYGVTPAQAQAIYWVVVGGGQNGAAGLMWGGTKKKPGGAS